MDLDALSRIRSMLVLGIDYVHLLRKLRMELRNVGLRTRCLEVYLGSDGGQPLLKKRLILARREIYLPVGRVMDVRMSPLLYTVPDEHPLRSERASFGAGREGISRGYPWAFYPFS